MEVLKCLGAGFSVLTINYMSLYSGSIDFIGQGILITIIMIVVFTAMQFGFGKEVSRETRKVYREWIEG